MCCLYSRLYSSQALHRTEEYLFSSSMSLEKKRLALEGDILFKIHYTSEDHFGVRKNKRCEDDLKKEWASKISNVTEEAVADPG